MDKTMLSSAEINWVNGYHQMVYDRLAPGLTALVREWLKEKTKVL